MKLSKKDIGAISTEFLELLDKESIFTSEDLERMIGKDINGKISGDRLIFDNRPSNLNTMAYTVSYVREGTGIPLELKMNPSLYYSQVILKSQEIIEGYSSFSEDDFGNIMQVKAMGSISLSLSRNELSSLSEM